MWTCPPVANHATVFVALNEILICCGYAQSVSLRTWSEAASVDKLRAQSSQRRHRPELSSISLPTPTPTSSPSSSSSAPLDLVYAPHNYLDLCMIYVYDNTASAYSSECYSVFHWLKGGCKVDLSWVELCLVCLLYAIMHCNVEAALMFNLICIERMCVYEGWNGI